MSSANNKALIRRYLEVFAQKPRGPSKSLSRTRVRRNTFAFRGVHRGAVGDLPPTGRQVTMEALIVYWIQDGKIVQHWLQADVPSMMRQLARIPTE